MAVAAAVALLGYGLISRRHYETAAGDMAIVWQALAMLGVTLRCLASLVGYDHASS